MDWEKYFKSYPEKHIKGMYLWGNVGVGKTYTMSQINIIRKVKVQNYFLKIDQEYSIRIGTYLINWPEHISHLKEMMNSDEEERGSNNNLKRIEILIIDDIGGEIASEWMLKDVLLPLINYRYEAKKVTFFTSNYSIPELKDYWNNRIKDKVAIDRVISRIKGMTTQKEMKGVDRRNA